MKPYALGGTTESQDAAWGEETDNRRALSATEDEFSSKLKTCYYYYYYYYVKQLHKLSPMNSTRQHTGFSALTA